MKQGATNEPVIVNHDQPTAPARLSRQQQPAVFGRMKGTVEVLGDLVASTGERWHADKY